MGLQVLLPELAALAGRPRPGQLGAMTYVPVATCLLESSFTLCGQAPMPNSKITIVQSLCSGVET